MEAQMGTIYALDTEAFKFSEESKRLDKSMWNEEQIKTYCMPEKIISYETTDSEYLLRRNRLSNFMMSRSV
jgi:hypothetical protein